MGFFFGSKRLTPAQQLFSIKQSFPESKVVFKNGRFIINLLLQPTPFSRNYPIELYINSNGECKVWLTGNIKGIDDSNFPHCYQVDNKNKKVLLCLFYPKEKEWDSSMQAVKTLVPWTCDWLFYYELWLDSGEWLGGGKHYDTN